MRVKKVITVKRARVTDPGEVRSLGHQERDAWLARVSNTGLGQTKAGVNLCV